MLGACMHVDRMPKMIQIRNVPDDVHRALKVRAAEEGLSLSAFLLREITELAHQPTFEEIFERARRRGTFAVSEDPVAIIRAAREAGS